MNIDTFQKEQERVAGLPVQEQKDFYANILETETQESGVRLEAYFQYAVLFYYEGNFRKAREILEPFAISYQSYEYIPRMISCFNLMGVASQCEGEYVLSRYFYTVALRIVRERDANQFYAYEYNNIALTYIAQKEYEKALKYIKLAEYWLPQSDGKMGAYIFLNQSDIYNHLNRLDEAAVAYETSIREHKALEVLPDDTIICGVTLYHHLGDKEKYREYVYRVLDKIEDMHASEFIDACKVVFGCSLKDGDYTLVERVIDKMDQYMEKYPDENKVGLQVEGLKYAYGQKVGNADAMLAASEKKNYYYDRIVSRMERQRADSMDEYLETHKHLQEAVQNEIHANRAKTRFLANMSHDIRTPMNAIVGITTLMEHSLNDPDKMRNYLEKIQRSSQYMLGLINDLLDMNKIESGSVHLNIGPTNLTRQIEQINDIIRTQTSERGQTFTIHTEHIRHKNLLADEVRLRQILLNVLTNAVKYTPRGGDIRLDIEEMESFIENKAKYRFAVTDTGMGMDEELIEHIFEPFKRGEDSVVNKIQGTGLGMAITKNIVDLMNGSIEVESEVDCGSRIAITLELEIDENESVVIDEDDGESAIRGMRFLCAEDNELNAEILVAILELEGATCTVYEDGAAIVEAFQSVKPGDYDAILMDVQMPRMNGYDATRRIREGENPLGQTIPIIAMTANAFADDVYNSLAAGMNAHISKPINIKSLERTLRRIRKLPG